MRTFRLLCIRMETFCYRMSLLGSKLFSMHYCVPFMQQAKISFIAINRGHIQMLKISCSVRHTFCFQKLDRPTWWSRSPHNSAYARIGKPRYINLRNANTSMVRSNNWVSCCIFARGKKCICSVTSRRGRLDGIGHIRTMVTTSDLPLSAAVPKLVWPSPGTQF